jgi:maltokinase
VREGKSLTTAAGHVRGVPIPGAEVELGLLGATPEARALGVEQSNTSLVFGDRVIMKILRKLEGGESPELEIGRFLATKTDFRSTPALLGSLELDGPAAASLALLHAFVPNAQDGWKWTLEQLERGVPAELLAEIRALGEVIARLHAALASDPNDPAFSPEPLLLEDLQRWSSSIIGELGVTLSMAEKQFPELAEQRQRLLEKAQRIAHLHPSGLKLRQHGDLHLGQVLRTAAGWQVIDFEGEPVRSATTRREKHTPLKDVAGMLRSFSYACAVAGLKSKAKRDAVRSMRHALLEGYTSVGAAMRLLPQGTTWHALLEALELDKVLYEVRYELQMRPDWVHIPVESLLPQEDT